MQSLRPHPDMLNHDLHFNRSPGWLVPHSSWRSIVLKPMDHYLCSKCIFGKPKTCFSWNGQYIVLSTIDSLIINLGEYLLVTKVQVLWKLLLWFLTYICNSRECYFQIKLGENEDVSSPTPFQFLRSWNLSIDIVRVCGPKLRMLVPGETYRVGELALICLSVFISHHRLTLSVAYTIRVWFEF